MPFWLILLVQILPEIPSTAEDIAEVFRPHVGTDTGTKISETVTALQNVTGAAVDFAAQHAAALQPQPAAEQQ